MFAEPCQGPEASSSARPLQGRGKGDGRHSPPLFQLGPGSGLWATLLHVRRPLGWSKTPEGTWFHFTDEETEAQWEGGLPQSHHQQFANTGSSLEILRWRHAHSGPLGGLGHDGPQGTRASETWELLVKQAGPTQADGCASPETPALHKTKASGQTGHFSPSSLMASLLAGHSLPELCSAHGFHGNCPPMINSLGEPRGHNCPSLLLPSSPLPSSLGPFYR